jgi:hypothetical protein
MVMLRGVRPPEGSRAGAKLNQIQTLSRYVVWHDDPEAN